MDISKILDKSYQPSGDPEVMETVGNQLENEKDLESIFEKYIEKNGFDKTGIEIFFKLFNVWIGMYRLDKCEKYLSLLDTMDLEGFQIRLNQAWAFTKWKQYKFEEALEYFKELEKIDSSVELFENIGHTYSSMGKLDLAMEYFDKCPKSGGVLLGLALLNERQGNRSRGIALGLEALQWYSSRFSMKGNVSSLEAKCAVSLARMYLLEENFDEAIMHANSAVSIFTSTCGSDSPLLGNALRVKAQIHQQLGEHEIAIDTYTKALVIETEKDGVELMTLIEIQQDIINTFKIAKISNKCLKPAFRTAVTACQKATLKLKNDGNLGAFYKIIGEFGIWAEEFSESRKLIKTAIPLLQTEESMDCSDLVKQCEHIITLLDNRIEHS